MSRETSSAHDAGSPKPDVDMEAPHKRASAAHHQQVAASMPPMVGIDAFVQFVLPTMRRAPDLTGAFVATMNSSDRHDSFERREPHVAKLEGIHPGSALWKFILALDEARAAVDQLDRGADVDRAMHYSVIASCLHTASTLRARAEAEYFALKTPNENVRRAEPFITGQIPLAFMVEVTNGIVHPK